MKRKERGRSKASCLEGGGETGKQPLRQKSGLGTERSPYARLNTHRKKKKKKIGEGEEKGTGVKNKERLNGSGTGGTEKREKRERKEPCRTLKQGNGLRQKVRTREQMKDRLRSNRQETGLKKVPPCLRRKKNEV